jgi:hypothetical protein
MDICLRLARPAPTVIKQNQRDILSDCRPPRGSCAQLGSRDGEFESPRETPQSVTI